MNAKAGRRKLLNPQLAKLTAPVLPRVVERPRLFRQLDRCGKNPVTWIVGPPGAGKTTLVASYLKARRRRSLWYRLDESDADLSSFFHYLGLAAKALAPRRREALPALTPEYSLGLQTFVRRYFERLCLRLPPGCTLVFDNYQDVPESAALHELLPLGLAEIPRHVCVIVMSRQAAPLGFSTLAARRQSAEVDAAELQLTPQETRQLIKLFEPKAKPEEVRRLETLAAGSRGWVAGVILLLERAKNQASLNDTNESSQIIFRYLAGEAIMRLAAERQEFLLKTSVLPEMTAAIAEALTGAPFANDYLSALYQARYFVERKELWYRFHPLFRDCLLEMASRRFQAEELRQLRQQGAQLLIAHERSEQGIGLLSEAHDWQAFVGEVLQIAPLWVKQGRIQTLENWLTQLPQPFVEMVPWVGFWRTICRIAVDPVEALRLAENNYGAFKRAGDPLGTVLSWSNIVMAIFTQNHDFSRYDPWLEQLPYDLPRDLPPMPPEMELMVVESVALALFWRQPGTARTVAWCDQIVALSKRGVVAAQGVGLFIVESHCLWLGDIAGAKLALELSEEAVKQSNYLPVKVAHAYASSIIQWFDGAVDSCRRTVTEGLELGKREGVHFWDPALVAQGAYNEIFAGNFAAARVYLDRLCPPPQLHRSFVHSLYLGHEGWLALQEGHFEDSLDFINQCNFDACGTFPEASLLIVKAYASLCLGKPTETAECLQRISEIAASMNSDLVRHGMDFLAAALAFELGDDARGYSSLRNTLEIGRRRGLFGWPGWHGPTVARLCARALEAGIDVEYVKTLLKKRWLPLPDQARDIAAWPWSVKIYTLGEFRILVDDEPLGKNRKAPHRLLEFLKTLIAFGAINVPATKLMDTLWPDADGAAARVNLEKTLQRVRRLLGHEQILPVRNGRVSLNAELCWVDAWAFEKLLDAKDQASRQRAVELYKGPFLGDEEELPWTDGLRERLGKKYSRAVGELSAKG